jgi:hypothetical protein
MKHIFSGFSIVCVALLVIFLSTNAGCKKGDDGAKGDTGTANVMYSPWLDVDFSPVVDGADTIAWTATIDAPKITKQILDSGTVKVYFNAGTSTTPAVFPLPLADFAYGLPGGVQNINLYFTVGKINLYATQDGGTEGSGSTKSWQYRYVIIPGGVPTGRSVVNWNSYETVKSFYNIPD